MEHSKLVSLAVFLVFFLSSPPLIGQAYEVENGGYLHGSTSTQTSDQVPSPKKPTPTDTSPAASTSQTPVNDTEFTRPENNLDARFIEDWSPLGKKKIKGSPDYYDPLKYVKIIGDTVWATFGYRSRVRTTTYTNFSLVAVNGNNTCQQEYVRASVDLHVGEHFNIFTNIEHCYVVNRQRLAGDSTNIYYIKNFDFLEVFANYSYSFNKEEKLSFRVGRQCLYFGKLRMISSIDFANAPKPFDLVAAIYEKKDFSLFAFGSTHCNQKKYKWYDDHSHQNIWGVYTTGKLGPSGPSVEPYYLGWARHQLNANPPGHIEYNSIKGYERRQNFGLRCYGSIKDTYWDYDFEGCYQIGSFKGNFPINPLNPLLTHKRKQRINAYLLVGELGYKFKETWAQPRFFLQVNYASGDRHREGKNLNTFCVPYPNGQIGQGSGVLGLSRQNCISLFSGIYITPSPKMYAFVNYTWYWRQSKKDGIYNSAGGFFRPGNLSHASYICSEIFALAFYRFTPHFYGYVFYGHCFPGKFLKETNPVNSKSIDWFEVALHHFF